MFKLILKSFLDHSIIIQVISIEFDCKENKKKPRMFYLTGSRMQILIMVVFKL